MIGYTDPITEKRKTKWIGLDLPKGEKKAVVNKALRDTIDRFQEQYEKECRGILSPESCSFLDFLHSWLINVKKPGSKLQNQHIFDVRRACAGPV